MYTPFVAPFPASHSGKNISIFLDTMIEELGLDGNQWELFSVQQGGEKITIRLAAQLWGFHFFSSTMLPMQLFVKFSMSLKISHDEYYQKGEKVIFYSIVHFDLSKERQLETLNIFS